MLVDVLKKAKKLSALTNGAFDVTVQPLWDLFRKHSLKAAYPKNEEIQKAKTKIGWQFIDIQKDHICMNKAGAQITLNGIAQGLAADMAKALKREVLNTL